MSYHLVGTATLNAQFDDSNVLVCEVLKVDAHGNTPFCEPIDDFICIVDRIVEMYDGEPGVIVVQAAARISTVYDELNGDYDVDVDVEWQQVTRLSRETAYQMLRYINSDEQ